MAYYDSAVVGNAVGSRGDSKEKKNEYEAHLPYLHLTRSKMDVLAFST